MRALQGLKNKFSRQSQNELELQESLIGADEEKKEGESLIGADEEKKEGAWQWLKNKCSRKSQNKLELQMAAMNEALKDVCNPNDERDKSFEEIGGGDTQVAPSQVKPGGVRSYDKDMQGYGVVGMLDVLEGILDNYKEMNKTCDSIETNMKDMQKQAATDMQELKDKMETDREKAEADRKKAEADRQKAEADMQELKDKMEADRQRAEADRQRAARMEAMLAALLEKKAPRKEESEERKVSFAEKEVERRKSSEEKKEENKR